MLTTEQIKMLVLFEIEKLLRQNGNTLRNFPELPYPDEQCLALARNTLIHKELSYNKEEQSNEHEHLFSSLTDEQKKVYETIITTVNGNLGGVFFLYGYGGTGKTYIWKTLSSAIRARGQIVLNVASSGIASLLLVGGRTAHSRFALPINIDENSLCKIQSDSELTSLLSLTRLIIWDEAPMIHKHCFEALDRSLKDIMSPNGENNETKPFGGKVVVFGGDFRQILSVIRKGSRQDIVNATINSSYLWYDCKVLKLKTNMRLLTNSDHKAIHEVKEFGDWQINIGEGKLGEDQDGKAWIDIPCDLLLEQTSNPMESLVSFVYPTLLNNIHDPLFFQERAILAPTHEVVDAINEHILGQIPDEEMTYLSSDSLCQSESHSAINQTLYLRDVLNSMKLSGLPNQ